MLVISRHRNESVMIGEHVEVFVTSVRAKRARVLVKHTDGGGRIALSEAVEHDGTDGSTFGLPIGGTVTIVDVRGESAILGIDVPPTLSVHRREVYEAIRGAKRD